MKTTTSFITLLLHAITAGTLLLSTQGAGYLKFDGVDGECQDKDHRGWSDLMSFSHGLRVSDEGLTGQSRRRGSVAHEPIVIKKRIDKSSPLIARSVMAGQVFESLEVSFTKNTDGGRVSYYRYELKNVIVSSYGVNIHVDESGEDVPVEEFSLNYEEIKVTYTETDAAGRAKGNVEYDWKVEEGDGIAAAEDEPTLLQGVRKELSAN